MSTDAIRDMILTARMQARLAHHIYYGESGVKALAEKYGARYRNFISNHLAASALIFTDHVHLCICGTDDEYDWAINLNSAVHQFGFVQAHKGFSDATAWLAEAMLHRGFAGIAEGKRLYIGGHSAGGAIAEMLPLYGSDESGKFQFKPEATFSFGAPKWCVSSSVGEYTAQKWKNYRFTMSFDPVPYLPLTLWRRMLLRPYFAHCVKAYELGDDGSWDLADDLTAAERVGLGLRSLITGSVATVIGSIKNVCRVPAHQSGRYLEALNLASAKYEN